MNYDFILAIDPSGAYYEGKGTTGWCVLETAKNRITLADSLQAISYQHPETYWQAHLNLIQKFCDKYGKNRIIVVIEDYILYKQKAQNQINSRMETCKVIGIIQHFCFQNKIAYTMQLAATVKKRWANEILEHNHYIAKKNKSYILPGTKQILNRHALDAVRHAVHYQQFKNRKEKR